MWYPGCAPSESAVCGTLVVQSAQSSDALQDPGVWRGGRDNGEAEVEHVVSTLPRGIEHALADPSLVQRALVSVLRWHVVQRSFWHKSDRGALGCKNLTLVRENRHFWSYFT